MGKKASFIFFELFVFIIIGGITLLEIFNFSLFQIIFSFIREYSSWFIGLSFAYIFSKMFQKQITTIFSNIIKKRISYEEEKDKNEDLFLAFLISLIIIALIIPLIKNFFTYIFTEFFIYFHIIFMQSIIIMYLVFRATNKYEISGKYFLTNETIVLINTILILQFIA